MLLLSDVFGIVKSCKRLSRPLLSIIVEDDDV